MIPVEIWWVTSLIVNVLTGLFFQRELSQFSGVLTTYNKADFFYFGMLLGLILMPPMLSHWQSEQSLLFWHKLLGRVDTLLAIFISLQALIMLLHRRAIMWWASCCIVFVYAQMWFYNQGINQSFQHLAIMCSGIFLLYFILARFVSHYCHPKIKQELVFLLASGQLLWCWLYVAGKAPLNVPTMTWYYDDMSRLPLMLLTLFILMLSGYFLQQRINYYRNPK